MQLGKVPARRALSSAPLLMWLSDVTSAVAEQLTDGLWMPTDPGASSAVWEVPPDGQLLLQLSAPAQLGLLQSALKVRISGRG